MSGAKRSARTGALAVHGGSRELTVLFDEISQLWRLGAETEVLAERLQEFSGRAKVHFDAQMRHLSAQNDESLLPICAQHEEMIHKIDDVLRDFAEGSGALHWHDMRRSMERALRRADVVEDEAQSGTVFLSDQSDATVAPRGSAIAEPLIEWPGDLAIGVEWIDRHHRLMIEVINRIGWLAEPYDPDDANALLEHLKRIAWHHFHEEEAHLGASAPDHLARHVGQHRRLLSELDFLIFDVRARRLDLRRVLKDQLCPWLIDHIHLSDRVDFEDMAEL